MVDDHQTGLYRLMGKIACIFGIPALLALAIGVVLDRFFSVASGYIFIMLGASFVLSWVLLWRFYRRIKHAEEATPPHFEQEINTSNTGTVRYDIPGVWKSKK